MVRALSLSPTSPIHHRGRWWMPAATPLLGCEQPTSCLRHPAPRSTLILGRSLEGLWRGPPEEIGCPPLRARSDDLKHHPQKANRLFHWIHRSILLSQLALQGFGEALALNCCSLWNYSQYSIFCSCCQGIVKKILSRPALHLAPHVASAL